MLFFLWSSKEKAWWRSKALGYTNKRSEAGIYTVEEALACRLDSCAGNTPEGADLLVPIVGKDYEDTISTAWRDAIKTALKREWTEIVTWFEISEDDKVRLGCDVASREDLAEAGITNYSEYATFLGVIQRGARWEAWILDENLPDLLLFEDVFATKEAAEDHLRAGAQRINKATRGVAWMVESTQMPEWW